MSEHTEMLNTYARPWERLALLLFVVFLLSGAAALYIERTAQ